MFIKSFSCGIAQQFSFSEGETFASKNAQKLELKVYTFKLKRFSFMLRRLPWMSDYSNCVGGSHAVYTTIRAYLSYRNFKH